VDGLKGEIMESAYDNAKGSGQHQRIRDLEKQGCVSGVRPMKAPLLEQFQKQRCHLVESLELIDRLLEILKAHPEFEAYQDFQELLRHNGY
jgi:hypothetical protein